jgi:hypothetical protein
MMYGDIATRTVQAYRKDTKHCQRVVTQARVSIEGDTAGIKSTGAVRIEAIDPEHVKFTSQIASGDGSQAMRISTTGTGKWTGACINDANK